ncbi:MAG: hemolysin family protein [Anaerolineales bacterium]|nr:hemolysin family protein [Anaerolineales bacterium]MCS7248406.1 hemolysin family protein [Anaerolineales bacterium]MDW8162219.1 hemolysin family protein [Anaerolineales bacterium]MDW8446394.1 hemolysin family protein [Anaerolineales bacterium]
MVLGATLVFCYFLILLIFATQTVFSNPFRVWELFEEKEGGAAKPGSRELRVAALHGGLAAMQAISWLGLGVTVYLLLNHLDLPLVGQLLLILFVLLSIVVGEWTLQALLQADLESWEHRLRPVARAVAWVFSPFLSAFAGGIHRLVPALSSTSSQEMAEELMEWVNVAQEQGEIESEHGKLIHSIFELSDTLAREIMVPRVDMVALEQDMSLTEAAQVFITSGHSRLPLYKETIDQIQGVIYAKDLLRVWVEGREGVSLSQLARPAYFIPEAKQIDELLGEMQQQRVHLAIVVDEYGGVAGLVTLEDIIEEILGEIQDEYDQAEELPYQELGAGEYLFQGRIDLGDFNEIMGSEFSKEEADTLGGFILQQLGRLPTAGEKLCVAGIELVVEQVSGRRIRKVRARRLDGECAVEDQDALG